MPWAVPSPKFHLKEYGVVPPLPVAVNVIDVPTDGLVGVNVKLATMGWPPIVTLAEPEALAEFESVTVKDSVFVPFVGSVLLNVPVPVYGAVPPDAVTVQLKGLPAVTPDVGHETLMAKG